jgi:hypothetical protein
MSSSLSSSWKQKQERLICQLSLTWEKDGAAGVGGGGDTAVVVGTRREPPAASPAPFSIVPDGGEAVEEWGRRPSKRA